MTYMTERYAHLIEGREHEAVNALPEWRTPSKELVAAGSLATIRQLFPK
jgi:hypothetical protein